MNKSRQVVIKNLQRIIEEKGLNQAQLAKELNVSKGFISMLFNGKRNFSQNVLEQLAEVLDVRISDLTKHESINSSEYVIHVRGKATSGVAKEAISDWIIEMNDFTRLSNSFQEEC